DAPITENDLLEGKGGDFAQNIPPGYGALAIKVNPECVVSGFVQPLSRVDVLWTLNRADSSQSMILLEDMLVLATDGEDKREDDKRSKLATTVTLAVKPDDTQKLALAAQNGELR